MEPLEGVGVPGWSQGVQRGWCPKLGDSMETLARGNEGLVKGHTGGHSAAGPGILGMMCGGPLTCGCSPGTAKWRRKATGPLAGWARGSGKVSVCLPPL